MTDAVREYREAGRFTLTSLPNASSDQWFVPASLADAAIAELEKRIAKLEAQKHGLATAAKLGMEAVARAEKATEYARIEVKRKNEAVETDLAARLRATGIAECAEYAADTAYLVGGRHKVAADACITRLLDEVDAAMSLVTAATREGVLAEALEHAERAEAEARKWEETARNSGDNELKWERVAEDLQMELLQAALEHDLTIPSLDARLARYEAEHGGEA